MQLDCNGSCELAISPKHMLSHDKISIFFPNMPIINISNWFLLRPIPPLLVYIHSDQNRRYTTRTKESKATKHTDGKVNSLQQPATYIGFMDITTRPKHGKNTRPRCQHKARHNPFPPSNPKCAHEQ
ncbi:hypothetical protein GUJ93_ZPchr0013g36691 [Zizania palustris]|uniref:Uncharacterized protein n=1 Tax=Zizania palustris TaxID=103762 RepID=A0A8J5WTC2_ZIZPA|nr:hypothetical protein GUJ93_ZPchr0013g36691 [Zizania palustris]